MKEHNIRIVVLDYYMSPPIPGLDVVYSEFRASPIGKVPVLRCFGSMATGQKVCIHIHGVFPYIYIPYDGVEDVNILMYQIASKLDKAVNVSMNQTNSNTQHVYKIQLVSGIPMYGYHSRKHQFLKIYLYNPLLITKVAQLLQNEQILGRFYQPHESHLNFTLQFMIDYNLHGMSFMKVSDVKFRGNPTDLSDVTCLPDDVQKISLCQLEGDVHAENILNRQEIVNGGLSVNPGIAAIWEDERQRRRYKNEESQIEHCLKMERTNIPPTNSHLIFKKALTDRLAVLSTDKENRKDDINLSVYPAETPESSNIQNASIVDLHTPSSLEISLDESISLTQSTDNLNSSIDVAAQDLVDILENLENNVESDLEEDCILSQTVNEEDDSMEDQLDMTIPLEALTTPTKIDVDLPTDEDSLHDADITLIPQLDGLADDESEWLDNDGIIPNHQDVIAYSNHENYDYFNVKPAPLEESSFKNYEKKKLFVKLKPLSWKDINMGSKTNEKCDKIRKQRKRKSENEKLNLEIKRMHKQIKKNHEASKLKRMMKFISKKERKLSVQLNASKPKFNIVPQKIQVDTKSERSNPSSLLNIILKQTNNYIDPNLHFKVTYPDNSCFLYYYQDSSVADVFQLPDEPAYIYKSHNYNLRTKDRNKLRMLYQNKCTNIDSIEEDPDFKSSYKSTLDMNVTLSSIDPTTYYKRLTQDSNPVNNKVKNVYLFSQENLTLSHGQPLKANLKESLTEINKKLQEYKEKDPIGNFETSKINSPNIGQSCETPTESLNSVRRKKILTGIKCLENTNQEKFEIRNSSKYQDLVNINKSYSSHNNFSLKKELPLEYILQEESAVPYLPIHEEHLINELKPSRNGYFVPKKLSLEHNVNQENPKIQDSSLNEELSYVNKSHRNIVFVKKELPCKSSDNVIISSSYKITPLYLLNTAIDTKTDSFKKEDINISLDLNNNETKAELIHNISYGYTDLPMPLKYSLDGTVDSSSESSEDELPVKNRKTNMQEGRSPKYSTLPISVASSSHRKKSTGHGNIEDIDRSEKISKEKEISESAVPTSTLPLKHCDIVKRNLFSSTSQHDLTEESIACTYSTSRESTIISFQPSNGSNSSSDNSTSNSQSDLFSPSVTQHNKSFFQKYNFKLSIASEASTSGTKIDNLNTTKKALVLSNKSSDSSNSESKSKDIANVIYWQYKTKSRAPTRLEVKQSLNDLNIAHVTKQEPFYSNVEDVTGAVEIGHNVLKIKSKTTADLSEFESVADGFNQFRKAFLVDNPNYNKSHIKNLMLSFYTDRKVIVAPVKKAPSNKEVRLWLTKNTRLSTPKQTKSKVNQKVHIPMSQNEDVADCDLSLSISSCTPIQSNSSMESGKLYLRKSLMSSNDSHNQSCQITGVSNDNSYGFEQSVQNFRNAKAVIEHQYLTIMAIELHVHTRGSLKPNPELDAIRAIFYSISNDVPNNYPKPKQARGVLAVNNLPNVAQVNSRSLLHSAYGNYEVSYVDSEEELLTDFVKLLVYWDPDILAGYEIQMLSWGYLIERASILNVNLLPQLGRSKISIRGNKENNPENIIGRIMLDVWRLMRHEIALQSYTFESIVYHILHKRVPFYSFKTLSFWWDHITNLYRHKTIQYYLFRVEVILELFDKLDLIGRTSELARLFGIQFYEVLSRGSQFRVESMMLRLAKPLNYIPVSPSVQQRAHMKAPEYIPLVMEPESKLYNDPIIVLDFQSLYPSIIIAYNYCFTTCVGRVECLGKNNQFEFGATNLKVAGKKVEKLVQKDLLNFSPCGVAFVKSKVRDGILPKMLREILDTRLMVKNSMKENKDDQLLQKVLHNRQLGLKLIANVTYGYTAANFSGRMCCVEVGDSVVSKGRETLQRAIAMVDNTPEWGARVVYGDTDSLFVLVAGRSRETAFEIGAKIADAVTKDNPDPVKLKLEKVYHPCILQTKKRYVGYMYESINQKEPVYDAKGIETVRRDGCPAVSKILEKCLRMLFETKDVSLIKKYVLRQFTKIVAGRANIQELTFAKEYRGASGYKAGACVPALELSKKWTAIDKRNEPRCGERVPYIIVNGPPGLPLIRLVRSPMDLLEDPSLRPNALYYITKVIIPPLNRCFGLIGCDVTQWFNQMPRKVTHVLPGSSPSKKSTISQYFATVCCASCNELTQKGLCETCLEHPQQTYVTLMEKTRIWEQNYNKTVLFCQSCTGCLGTVSCVSLDCPVLYRRIQTNQDLQQANFIRELLNSQDMLF